MEDKAQCNLWQQSAKQLKTFIIKYFKQACPLIMITTKMFLTFLGSIIFLEVRTMVRQCELLLYLIQPESV